jgi:hypothetical protein
MAKRLPRNGRAGKVHRMDARVGTAYKMSFTNFRSTHPKGVAWLKAQAVQSQAEASMAPKSIARNGGRVRR